MTKALAPIIFVLTWLASPAFAQVDYSPNDSSFIVSLLKKADRSAGTSSLALSFAREFIGLPYVAHTLEAHETERLIVDTRRLDCTTLVENVAALTICAAKGLTAFSNFTSILTALRYHGGKIDQYPSRLHYFSEWIEDNTAKGFVNEIQTPNPPFTAVQRLVLNYMSRHTGSYKALRDNPAFVREIIKHEKALAGKTYKYIPKAEIKNTAMMRNTINDGDIIAIVSNKPGLDIAHVGVAVWHKDGLHLLNASMIHHKVVEEPMTLRRYLQKHPSHLGIRVIRINNNN